MTSLDRRSFVAVAIALATSPVFAAVRAPMPGVVIRTDMGTTDIEFAVNRTPITAANFLRYVDARPFDRGGFYRVVRPDNDHDPATITVVQGGLDSRWATLPPIAYETTAMTDIRNTDGVVSMARNAPATETSRFSISIGDNPALDFGGLRSADRHGFAAFGGWRTAWSLSAGSADCHRIRPAPTPTSPGRCCGRAFPSARYAIFRRRHDADR